MNKLLSSVRRFLASEAGPTAVEYAVMLALVILVCILAITQLGQTTNSSFTSTNAAIS
jgi:pilus assembly protein Flp/PilA